MTGSDYPIELLHWVDACGPDAVSTFHPADLEHLEPLGMNEVGFVLKETDTYLILAPQINDEGGIRRLICIPKNCITRREKLWPRCPKRPKSGSGSGPIA